MQNDNTHVSRRGPRVSLSALEARMLALPTRGRTATVSTDDWTASLTEGGFAGFLGRLEAADEACSSDRIAIARGLSAVPSESLADLF